MKKVSPLFSELNEVVCGQPDAIDKLRQILVYGMHAPAQSRLRGHGLALGPTGTGKTLTIRHAARLLDYPFVKINCAELAGAQGLEVALGRNGLARCAETETGVLLLDELEKGSSEFHRLLLSLLDDASVQLRDGRSLDLSGWFLFATSNVGGKMLLDHATATDAQKLESLLLELEDKLLPEIVGRFRQWLLFFRQLTLADQKAIAALEVGYYLDELRSLGYRVTVRDQAAIAEYFALIGFDLRYGGRSLRDTIRQGIGFPVTQGVAVHGRATKISIAVSEDRNRLVVTHDSTRAASEG